MLRKTIYLDRNDVLDPGFTPYMDDPQISQTFHYISTQFLLQKTFTDSWFCHFHVVTVQNFKGLTCQ